MPTSSRTAQWWAVRTTATVQYWWFLQYADVGISPYDGLMACVLNGENDFLCYVQKILEKIMKKAKIMLDIHGSVYYNKRARVWDKTARTAMMQEIASKDGNFCGVCPVIGRLRQACMWRISPLHGRQGRHKSAIFHASGVIRTVKRTRKCLDRTQKDMITEYVSRRKQHNGKHYDQNSPESL